MTREQVIERLKARQGASNQKEFAEKIGITPQYLSDVYLGRREPGRAILNFLGLSLVKSYEKEGK